MKLIFAGLWLLILVLAAWKWFQSELTVVQVPGALSDWLGHFGLAKAAAIYVILYAVRPLTLFPATFLTMAAGLIFGPWLGILFTIIGENVSANVAFVVGRYLGRDWVASKERGAMKDWEEKLSRHGLITVMIMRLLFLPFDAINYGCGVTQMKQRDFAIGTFIGIMPGLIAIVLLGATANAGVGNRLYVFFGFIFFFVLGLVVAKLLGRPDSESPQ